MSCPGEELPGTGASVTRRDKTLNKWDYKLLWSTAIPITPKEAHLSWERGGTIPDNVILLPRVTVTSISTRMDCLAGP